VQVNADLLKGTAVRFVGTATSGFDHVDLDYLKQHGVGFAYAPGSNAASVAEYVTAALLHVSGLRGDLAGKSIGIVGYGHVGREVRRCAEALGLRCLIHYTPLARRTGDKLYRPMDEILRCDIVTLHVPLTLEGPDATYRMVDRDFVAQMRNGSVLINTARGEVVDPDVMVRGEPRVPEFFVFDVWNLEPEIDVVQAFECFLGTPHIAGHSFDGKVDGTRMLYEAFCAHERVRPMWDAERLLPPPDVAELTVDPANPRAIHDAVRAVYDIMIDHQELMGTLGLPDHERGEAFDRLRKNYRRRRSFSRTRVRVTKPDKKVREMLRGLGFEIV
jgi:erythronate-4-phosphate dehydrogenase